MKTLFFGFVAKVNKTLAIILSVYKVVDEDFLCDVNHIHALRVLTRFSPNSKVNSTYEIKIYKKSIIL